MRLNERIYLMLRIMYELRVVRALDIAWLAGYTNENYCRKVLKKLENAGYVKIVKDRDGWNCYYISKKGLKEIGYVNSKEFEVTSMLDHYLSVARLVTYLYIAEKYPFNNIKADMSLRKSYGKYSHRPDIVVGDVAYEVELNHKQRGKLEKNLIANDSFKKQIWVIPKSKKSIGATIKNASKYIVNTVDIMYLDEIYAFVNSSNLQLNKYREENTVCNSNIKIKTQKIEKYIKGE